MTGKAEYEVAIIGGGPAGSAAAIIAARRGLRVLLLERGSFPRHKVCGEFVSSESLALLRDLLREEDDLLRRALPIERFSLYAGSQSLAAAVEPAAASISRYDLDDALFAAARRSGAECRIQSEVARCEHGKRFLLHTSSGQITARAVINASGRWSRLSPHEAAAGKKVFVGWKAHFIADDLAHHGTVRLFFGRDGYCGVQPVRSADRIGINVCAMLRPGALNRLPSVLHIHSVLAECSRAWKQCTPPFTTAPLFFRDPTPLRDSIFQVGDAAAFIDPFVGDGIAIALRTGAMAAEAAAEYCIGSKSLDEACAQYSAQYYAVVVPALRNAARVRRVMSLPTAAQAPILAALNATGAGGWLLRATRSRAAIGR